MPRTLLVALLLLALRCAGQQTPPTALDADPSSGGAPLHSRRARINLAEEALAAGLAGSAAELFGQALADPALSAPDRERAGLGLTAGLIERGRMAEARAALTFIPASPAKALREGLLDALENNLPAARIHAAAASPDSVPAQERSWAWTLRWMLAEAAKDTAAALTAREEALRAATSTDQRGRIEGLALVRYHEDEDLKNSIVALRELTDTSRGTPLHFAYSRNLALAYSRIGKAEEGVKVLSAAAPLPPGRQSEADLLAGLMLEQKARQIEQDAAVLRKEGKDERQIKDIFQKKGRDYLTKEERDFLRKDARDFLRKAARNPSDLRIRVTALRSLVAAVSPADDRTAAAGIANETYDFLMRPASSGDGYLCPRNPEVLDAIHLTRAQLMLDAGNFEKARLAAEDLLKEAPASPLSREATRVLALSAWGEGAYRLTATHLSALAEGAQAMRRDVLRSAAADCLFLASDYMLAEKAYASVQAETSAPDIMTSAFRQRVHCLLRQGDDPALWKRATEVIEDAARGRAVVEAPARWSSAWNLVDTIRRAGQAGEAGRTLARLQPVLTGASVDFTLRFEWQRALIALALAQRPLAAQIADGISKRLESLPADAPPELLADLASLRGQVALLKIRALTGAEGESLSARSREEIKDLRLKYPKTAAAASSYLFEGRELSRSGRHAEAQAAFTALADGFKDVPNLRHFSRLGLYEAAEQAALLYPSEGDGRLREAVVLLERFAESGAEGTLAFHAAMRRSEMLRALGEFDLSLRLLDDLIREMPSDPSRPRAELARGDTLLGLVALRTKDNRVDRQRASRAAAAYERVADTWGKDSPDIRLEARHKQALALLERSKAESGSDRTASSAEAKALLVANGATLRSRPGDA
ncbi:MAG: hypothetical protein ACO3ND_05465, partial [Opitutales bacterium]